MEPADVSLKSETDSDAPEWCNSQSMSETLSHDPEEVHFPKKRPLNCSILRSMIHCDVSNATSIIGFPPNMEFLTYIVVVNLEGDEQ